MSNLVLYAIKGSVTIISLYATRDASGGVLSFG
jgi:hypothetical protein